MTSFFTNKLKDSTNISDEVIASNMMAGASAGATAYFNSGMVSTTPELKAMYLANLNQMLGGHTAIMELAVEKGWENPYDAPSQQLLDLYNKSQETIE